MSSTGTTGTTGTSGASGGEGTQQGTDLKRAIGPKLLLLFIVATFWAPASTPSPARWRRRWAEPPGSPS